MERATQQVQSCILVLGRSRNFKDLALENGEQAVYATKNGVMRREREERHSQGVRDVKGAIIVIHEKMVMGRESTWDQRAVEGNDMRAEEGSGVNREVEHHRQFLRLRSWGKNGCKQSGTKNTTRERKHWLQDDQEVTKK